MGKPRLRDFDPESLLDPAPSSSEDEHSEFASEEDTQAGREHYADVGKSKLRKKEVVPLGPQYNGSKISRQAVDDEDSDDPFAREYNIADSEDEDEDEDDDDNDEEEAQHVKDGVALANANKEVRLEDAAFSGEDVDEDMLDDDEEEEEDDDEDSIGDSEDNSEIEDASEGSDEDVDQDQTAKLREMMKDTILMKSAISQAAKTDVEKGNAIKAQRKTFDTLLNTRIRLQKALISTNSLAADTHSKSSAPDSAIEAAENAALTLLNNLTQLRSSLDEAHAGQKRKRQGPYTSSTPSSSIWSDMQASESHVQPHRNAILEKWSTKTRGATLASSKGRLNTTTEQTLTDVLNAQLQDTSRLVARTQVARSCAPLQSAAKLATSEDIYDDADFYGLLLKELLENRSNQLNANGSASEFIVQAPWQVARDAKTRKMVDTKASKGRKMRYTVHEKLQNFMAPEDRGTWGERQRDELFGGLFGRRVGLGEDEDVQSDEDDAGIEEEGLMLFRS